MYIKKVSLENIRGFEKLELDLTRPDGSFAGWTVFTGGNGAGKSTLLRAITIGHTKLDYIYTLDPKIHKWVNTRKGATEGKINLQLALADGTLSNHETTIRTKFSDIERRLSQESELESSPSKPPRFSCGYGPFRRVFGASQDALNLMNSPILERYATMFQESASLSEVDQWLRTLNYKVLEGKSDEKEQLELVLEILRDDLLPNQITVDRVDSDGLWLKDRNNTQLGWGEMSDGYRSSIALLADILRHMINTFGTEDLTGRGTDGKLFIKPAGVVFVDEVDAHLHPEWQREIGFWLKKHFPNIQFLVTSHSPLICQAADPNGLFVLPEPGSNEAARALTMDEYNKVIISRPDTILLTPAFGLENTRSPRAVSARADYARLQAKKRAGATLTADEQEQEQALKVFAENHEEA